MEWTPEAAAAVKKVPFFIRKKVRRQVENKATANGKREISLADVKMTQAHYLANMSNEITGYRVDTCFGSGGCPNRANHNELLIEKIEILLKKEDLLTFLKNRVAGDIKFHHEFRVALADCPNACSQPQIKDIGIIGAKSPMVADETCTLCDACVAVCREGSVNLNKKLKMPEIDFNTCLACGKCTDTCPTGTLQSGKKGYRVQLGGKLGRHPKFARELKGFFGEAEVLEIVKHCIDLYKRTSKNGKRFAALFQDTDFEAISQLFCKSVNC